MESQLPNIKGAIIGGVDCSNGNGAFKRINNGNKMDWNGGGRGAFDFDASRVSSIYKDDITQVHPDSIGLNSWIKAKRLMLNI